MSNPLNSIKGTLVLGVILMVVAVLYSQLFRAASWGTLTVVTLLFGVVYWIVEAIVIDRQ